VEQRDGSDEKLCNAVSEREGPGEFVTSEEVL